MSIQALDINLLFLDQIFFFLSFWLQSQTTETKMQ